MTRLLALPNTESIRAASTRNESKHEAGAEGAEEGEEEPATLLFKYHQTSQAMNKNTKMMTRLAKEP